MDLNEKVFGSLMIREIIGETPVETEIKKRFDDEFSVLIQDLKDKSKDFLNDCLNSIERAGKLVNSHPGAMALAQGKIQLFNEYNKKYQEQVTIQIKSS